MVSKGPDPGTCVDIKGSLARARASSDGVVPAVEPSVGIWAVDGYLAHAPAPMDHHRAIGIGLLQRPGGALCLMCEVPLRGDLRMQGCGASTGRQKGGGRLQ